MKYLLIAVSFAFLNLLTATAELKWGSGHKCQILDKGPLPVYELSGVYIEEADFEGGSDSGLMELTGNWGCAYFRDVLSGDLDTHIRFHSTFFLRTAALDLPENVTEISLDLLWINRLRDGVGIIAGLTPGLYSDLERIDADGLYMPIRVAGVKSFAPRVSGIAGLDLRLGFDREIMPIIGIQWQPAPAFRLELGLPESLIRVFPSDEWSIYGKFLWSNVSYSLRERNNDSRDQLTMDDFRSSLGVQVMMDDQIGLIFEAGRVYHRSMVFELRDGSSSEHEIDDSLLLKFGVAGYF